MFLLKLLFQGLDLCLVALNLISLIFDGAPAVFQIRQKVLKAFFLLTDVLFGGRDNLIGETQLGRDGKGVAFAIATVS